MLETPFCDAFPSDPVYVTDVLLLYPAGMIAHSTFTSFTCATLTRLYDVPFEPDIGIAFEQERLFILISRARCLVYCPDYHYYYLHTARRLYTTASMISSSPTGAS